MPKKKKNYIELPKVEEFFSLQPQDILDEYFTIVEKLENEGRLSMPFGEKIEGKNLFSIRIINTANIRVFYVYGKGDDVFGIHCYRKTTRKIPDSEMRTAVKTAKILKQAGII